MMYVAGSLSMMHVSDKHKVRTTGSCEKKQVNIKVWQKDTFILADYIHVVHCITGISIIQSIINEK